MYKGHKEKQEENFVFLNGYIRIVKIWKDVKSFSALPVDVILMVII